MLVYKKTQITNKEANIPAILREQTIAKTKYVLAG